ncbi:hypothetical protein BDW22DRAFT_846924 [Trametopsis cervina]|nr:hypothetical protein BDW22DRAFT_846924 [Trametopsis cervina]
MRFFTLASAVALAFVGVHSYNSIGESSCNTPGGYGCSQDSNVNDGNAFIYECEPSGAFVYIAGCRCPTCCKATVGGTYCT